MACHKYRHPTRDAAKFKRNQYKDAPPMAVYRCEDCGYWHFGHYGKRMKAIEGRKTGA